METKNISQLKSDIDCILENYVKEVFNLTKEASDLYFSLEKSNDSLDLLNMFGKLSDIEKRKQAIEECKEDCIINL